jgi:hypothetical protein
MIPFIEPEMVPQHHAHILAYADLLAQWSLHHKSTEVRKSIPNLQKSKIELQVTTRDTGKILSVERSCIQCATTSDGHRPFGTCSHNHNWSSSMKCTVCRLPTRGKYVFIVLIHILILVKASLDHAYCVCMSHTWRAGNEYTNISRHALPDAAVCAARYNLALMLTSKMPLAIHQ